MASEFLSTQAFLEKISTFQDNLSQQISLNIDLSKTTEVAFCVTPRPCSLQSSWYMLPSEIVEQVQVVNYDQCGSSTFPHMVFVLKSPTLAVLLSSLFNEAKQAKEIILSNGSGEIRILENSFPINYYAPPSIFGPWVVVASHTTALSFGFNFGPTGDTSIDGEVRYYSSNSPNQKVVNSIFNGTIIRTANVIANVEVRFRGVLTGSAVTGTVTIV